MEAAHIPWRPLGRLLVEQGLLTDEELEFALAKQQTTGRRLGETIVECGFVSSPDLSNALAAQYGIELIPETGFGTGLRAQIQRRHESDRGRPALTSVPDFDAPSEEPLPEFAEPEPAPAGEVIVLAQLEEQWAKLAAAEEWVAEREAELTVLTQERDRRRAQAERLSRRARGARLELSAQRERNEELMGFTEAVDGQVDEQRAKLEAAEERLAEHERELAALAADRDRRRAQVIRFLQRVRARDAALEQRNEELMGITQAVDGQVEEQRAKLAAAEKLLAERERELAALTADRDRQLREAETELHRLAETVDVEVGEQRTKLAAAEKLLAERERELAALTADRDRQLREAETELHLLAETVDVKVGEERTKLAAAENLLAERERELAGLTADRDRRRTQAVGFVRRMRTRDEELAGRLEELHALGAATEGLRDEVERLTHDVRGCDAEIERLRNENTRRRAQAAKFAARVREAGDESPEASAPAPVPATSHLVFVQLARGYELVERDGPPPSRNAPLELPELCDGPLVVAGSRPSPFPGDTRPCVVVALR